MNHPFNCLRQANRLLLLVVLLGLAACSDDFEQLAITSNATESDIVCVLPYEPMPEYKGGYEALHKYLTDNNQFVMGQETVAGTVFVGFTITETGKVDDVQVLKGFYKRCDREAVRLVSQMPNWIPAQKDGISISVKFVLPVRFNL